MNTIRIYTDGSCNTYFKVGAWAAILIIDQTRIVLSDLVLDTTNNRMELTAVIESLKYVLTTPHRNNVSIYSDSQFVLNLLERKDKLLKNNFITSTGKALRNSDLITDFYNLITQFDITFIKIKAHQKKTEIENLNREVDKRSRKLVRDYVKEKIANR